MPFSSPENGADSQDFTPANEFAGDPEPPLCIFRRNALAEPARDVIFGPFVARVCEDFVSRIELDKMAA